MKIQCIRAQQCANVENVWKNISLKNRKVCKNSIKELQIKKIFI